MDVTAGTDLIWVPNKQARKSSEDAQATKYAQFGKSLGWVTFGSKKFGPKILAYLQYTFGKYTFRTHTHTRTHYFDEITH